MIDDLARAREAVTLTIEGIAAGGDGVARRDGLVVFVARTAPGDTVEAYIEQEKRFARGRLRTLVAPSALRVEPACPHYREDNCGGCQLQHMSLAAQRDAKRGVIRDSIQRIGKRTISLPDLHAGPSEWRYRHRLSLAIRKREDGSWYAGLHRQGSPGSVFPLRDCLIADPRLIELWSEVMGATAEFPEASELRGTVRLVGTQGTFVLEGGTRWPRAEAFVARLSGVDGVWWVPRNGTRRRVAPGATASAGASFTQVNPEVAALLRAHVLSTVVSARPTQAVDAYAGTGDLAVALQERGVRVTAVELDEEAAALAAARLAAPSRAVSARVEDVISEFLPTDVVVLNPPRSGVDARVTRALESSAATPRVVYVSCDPASLARDISRLPSWRIDSVTAFDMFPQTAHVETVVSLVRSAA